LRWPLLLHLYSLLFINSSIHASYVLTEIKMTCKLSRRLKEQNIGGTYS